jgi:eukaryotic-like serine/threonine-protein kinase
MTDPRTPEHWTLRATLPAAPGDFVPGTLLGDWSVEQKIGEGGMGIVYAAVHAEIGKRAALKVIRLDACSDASSAERFVQEARLVNQIGHPNIVDIFHIGRLHDGRPYLVMELLRGQTLGERIAAGRVPSGEAIELLLQICGALDAAHAHGVVHRDLKPDNIFVVETRSGPVVKLVDWGIAKLNDTSMSSTAMTRTGALVGTPQYLSPEQARGKVVDERTDLYSLGVIAYELLLEEPPFTADNVADLIAMHLREPVPAPSEVWPDIPPALERLLVAMLAKTPDGRPNLPTIIEVLEQSRGELAARHESRRHVLRTANGSLPAELFDGRVVTASGGVPIAFVTAPSGPAVRVLGSGPMQAIADEIAVPAVGTMTSSAPRRRRRGGLVAVALVTCVAAAAITGAVIVSNRDDAPAEPAAELPSPPPEPAPVAAAPVAAAPVVTAPAPVPSVLEIVVEPASARVHIDGEVVEVEDGRAIREVTAGAHQVVIAAPGHVTATRTLEAGAGTLRIEIELQEAPRRHHRRGTERRPPETAPAVAPADPDGTIDPFE